MAKKVKKREKKSSENYKLNADIAGVILIAFGIFSFISLIEPEFGGILGQGLFSLLIFLFGIGAAIFPFICMFLGYCYIKISGSIKYSIKAYGFMLLIFSILLLVGQREFHLYGDSTFFDGAKKLFKAKTLIHGGIISYAVLSVFNNLIGSIGSYIVIFASFLISITMILNKSIMELFPKKYIKDKLKRKREDLFEDKEIHKDENLKQVNEKKEGSKGKKYNIFKTLSILDEDIEEEEFKVTSRDIKVEDSHEDLNKEESIDEHTSLEREILENASSFTEEYVFPDISFLRENLNHKLNKSDKKELISSATKLEDTLDSFGVNAKVVQVSRGPAVTRYELQPSVGVKVNKIVNLADDIALNLAASGVRIEAPIPGKAAVGIEIPNKEIAAVYLKEIIESTSFKDNKKNISFALGKDISGSSVVADLTKMPHLLIAGATGSGKSVCINTLIISILYKYSPKDVKLIMVDPKMVELSMYNGIPHLLVPVVTNPKKAAGALNWAVNEMTRRYETFANNNVRNIEGYNELYEKGKITDKMQWVVIIIDELADLMMVCPKDIEDYIARLAQMARAAGMHLVIATQRPSVDVITGVIKANIPSRISFAVSSQIDSRTILDSSGAEKLLGRGDMLYYPVGENKPLRVQGAFISEEEVETIVKHIKSQKQEVEYKEELLEQINSKTEASPSGNDNDDLLNEAIKLVVENNQASTSFLQRKLRIGFNRASRIMEELEENEIISKRDGVKQRKVLISKEDMNL